VRHGKLWEGARAILRDAWVLENVRALAAEMAALGGPDKAAEYILSIIV
jgi:hypothetical protein